MAVFIQANGARTLGMPLFASGGEPEIRMGPPRRRLGSPRRAVVTRLLHVQPGDVAFGPGRGVHRDPETTRPWRVRQSHRHREVAGGVSGGLVQVDHLAWTSSVGIGWDSQDDRAHLLTS